MENEFVGKAEISAKEYRELIEESANVKKDIEITDSRYWDKYSEVQKLEKICEAQKQKIAEYADFILSSEEISKAFKEYRLSAVWYKINTVTEYGKLIAFCIENDINVWRSYWSKDYYYLIDWETKRLYILLREHIADFEPKAVIKPKFILDEWNKYKLITED